MWRPTVLGDVIAEDIREMTLGDVTTNVHIKVGKPVREPSDDPNAPWFCPVLVSGIEGIGLVATPGETSLQALLLGIQLIGRCINREVSKHGGHLELEETHGLLSSQRSPA